MSKLDCLCILHVFRYKSAAFFPYKSAAFFQSFSMESGQAGRCFYMKSFDGLAETLKRVSCDVKRTVKQAQLPRVYQCMENVFGHYFRHE